MKPRVLTIILAIAAGSAFTNSSAQTFDSSYFMDGATFRHNLNPAFMGERNYISMPGLGNINIGTNSNMGLTNFLFKFNDPNNKYNLTTFMSPTVGREEFLNKLKTNNRFNFHTNMTLLSTGFYGMGGFNTIEISAKSNSTLNMPYELFNFMKTGMDQNNYHIKDFSFNSNNYVELALGHSRKIDDKLTVGAKLKFLVGAANIDAKIDQMDVALNGDKWEITTHGTLNAAVGGATFKTKAENPGEIDGVNTDKIGVGGFGSAIDLGATYKLRDDLLLSAAVTDLGFISWTNNLKGSTHSTQFTFDGFENIAVKPEDGDPNSLKDQTTKIKDDLKELAKFYDDGKSSRTTMLTSTVNLGAEYFCPFYNKLSVGLLSTTHIGNLTWTKAMLAANVKPLKWFGASVNYSYSTYGSSLGWMLNFHPKGFNFFMGTDYMITNVTPQFVPTGNLNTNVCLGFNITFGKRRVN